MTSSRIIACCLFALILSLLLAAWADASIIASPRPASFTSPRLEAQLSPPATIRVVHDARNTYWTDWPVGEVRTFDFEYYVKHVIPYEVPCSWPIESLKAQAIAARTYAWNRILGSVNRPWDVTDYADTQMMGPNTYPNCELAVESTRGQYIAYQGSLISAMYSAENGDPTLDLGTVPYLRGIEDPVGFARERNGHGHGLSQWGANRWAGQYNWDYQKILLHYYTDVSVELPLASSPDTAPPMASLVLPWSQWYVTGSRLFLRANASDGYSGVARSDFSARFANGTTTTIGSDNNPTGGWTASWDMSAIADQPITSPVVLSVTVRDVAGNASNAALPAYIGLDRTPPSVTASLDQPYGGIPTVTLRLSGNDTGSGLAAMAFSNNWVWEGEDLPRWTGSVVSDSGALNGSAWRARVGIDAPGNTYGPFTTILPAGQYRAYFRLKTTGVLTTAVIARLDVITSTAGMTGLIGLHDVRGGDFRVSGQYQEFAVEFDYRTPGEQLEFRTHFPGVADIYFDRVLIVSYPVPFAATATWNAGGGALPKTVRVKAVDAAGNVSDDAVVVIGGPTPTPTPTAPTATATTTATPTATTTTGTKTPTATATATTSAIRVLLPIILADYLPPPTATPTAGPTSVCSPGVIATFAVGREPHGIAVAPGRIYVANFTGLGRQGTVSVLDSSTGEAVVPPIPVGLAPNGAAYNPANGMVYVANRDSNNVSVINTVTNQVVATIPVGNMPNGVAVDPSTDRIYVANWGSNNVSVVSGASNTVIATPATGSEPAMIAVNPETNRVYVSNHGSNSVTVIRSSDNMVIQTIAVSTAAPYGITVNPTANRLYVAGIVGGRIAVIDGVTGSILRTTAPPGDFHPWQVAANGSTGRVFVTSSAGGTGSGFIYEENSGEWRAGFLVLGMQPEQGITLDSTGGRIYIANAGSDSVTVIQDCPAGGQ